MTERLGAQEAVETVEAAEAAGAKPGQIRLLEQARLDSKFDVLIRTWPGGHVNVTGLADNQKAYLLAAASHALGQPAAVYTADELTARRYEQALRVFARDPERVQVFRARDLELGEADAASREMEQQRMGVLRALTAGEVDYLIVSGSAALQRLPAPADWKRHSFSLQLGGFIEPDELAQQLLEAGYERVPQAQNPGEFARRGDITDIVPAGLAGNQAGTGIGTGYRVSFFDNEIDQLKTYDIATQRSIEPLAAVLVTPAAEILLPADAAERVELAERVRSAGSAAVLEMKRNGIQREITRRLSDHLERDVTSINEMVRTPGLDKWLAELYGGSYTILDYLTGMAIAVDEPLRLGQRLDAAQAELSQRVIQLLERGQTFALASEAQLKRLDVFKALDDLKRVLSLAAVPGSGNGFPGGTPMTIVGREAESYRGHEDRLPGLLADHGAPDDLVVIMTASQERGEKLRQYLVDREVTRLPLIVPARLERGFEWPAARLLLFGAEDIFGRERQLRRRRRRDSAGHIDFFSDLHPGQKVVHENYGIGLYEGLTTNRDANGVKRDFLTVTYAGGDRLYLPMEQLDQLQKYVGTSDKEPKLSKIGGGDWSRLKERARDSIKKLATNLVKLYARREAVKGHIFPQDTVWDEEFAAAFPYEETEDQLRCIAEVKRDMESDKVMDRLLCGDVGFGKTEVAFRAMFKAAQDSKQSALLCPTTVLAQQHYENLIERVENFPVRIGLLSRFASEAEQKKTIRGLANGSIDMVVGTHRLLSKDVMFKDLGLLVVDEEQRFGVDHKEKIKSLKTNVDVLTLSATPIPRTLHMSLSGIRDISIIEEPPEDRRPVQTYVMEFDEAVIDDAILREISREGQVFYLYNDTRRIAEKAAGIAGRLPGARVLVAHGRMGERQLEDVITAFINGEADILCSTTIIESGIDMPNVNTIIMENADRLGLAQLYQLRGRVGRSSRQAYAYVTYKKDKALTEVAEKRLTAIRDFTELGAGFKVALRDLEVRGAGNLLGGEQHGQMEAIGYDLYTRMLEEEIQNARVELVAKGELEPGATAQPVGRTGNVAMLEGEASVSKAESGKRPLWIPDPAAAVACTVDLALDSYIPRSYIPDDGERMDMYRRIGSISTLEDYQDVLDELQDRYGDSPLAVQTLCDIAWVRHRAGAMGMTQIRVIKGNVVMQLNTEKRPDMALIMLMIGLPQYKGKLLFNAGAKPYILYRGAGDSPAAVPGRLRKLLIDLDQAAREAADSQSA